MINILTMGFNLDDFELSLSRTSAWVKDREREGGSPLASTAPSGWIQPRISVVKYVC